MTVNTFVEAHTLEAPATGQRLCPACGVARPVREFRVYDDLVQSCRACRRRAESKQRMRDRRETSKFKVMLQARIVGKETYREKKVMEAKLKFIKAQYLAATLVTRRRLKEMKAGGEVDTGRTVAAIKKREDILERYEKAYEQQIKLTKDGAAVPNIHDMI